MANLGTFILLAVFVVAATPWRRRWPAPAADRARLVESGIGAFYLVTALMTVASALIVHAFATNDYSIKHVQRYSDAAQPLFYKLTSYWGGLDGSIMFWVFLLALFGSIAVYVNRDRHRELIPYVVATIAVVQMFFIFLMVIHNNPFETFLDAAADGRPRAEPAAPEFLHGHPSAVALRRLRRHDDPVCLRHRGAGDRPPGRLLAPRGPALDDDGVAVPLVRSHARHAVGLRGAGLGRLLDVGSGRECRAAAVVHRDGVPALRSWCRSAAACFASGTSRWSSSRSS